MDNEVHNEHNLDLENIERLFDKEIRQALSPVFAKSTQELLPHYLPDLPISELSPEELDLYNRAYAIVGEMVKRGDVDVVFEHDNNATEADTLVLHAEVTRPKFKWSSQGGKKVD